jgi:septum formation protein
VTIAPILILASTSPRRRQLLSLVQWAFEVFPADIDETQQSNEAPANYVMRLAETKARKIAPFYPNCLVFAADTAVVDGKDVLGKPASAAEAANLLQRLRGHTHQVLTAIALFKQPDNQLVVDLCTTAVPMRRYTAEEIDAYVATGDPLDKAGAYAIQHPGFHPVSALEGCYASVMGLPLCHLARSMRRFGHLRPPVDVPAVCQAALSYACPVYSEILSA